MTSCEKKIRQKNSGRKFFFSVILAGFPVQKMQHKNLDFFDAYFTKSNLTFKWPAEKSFKNFFMRPKYF